MRLPSMGLGPWALALGLGLLLACAPRRVVYLRMGPPPPRVEVMALRPGVEFVWIPGFWRWEVATYVWVAGHWERPPRRAAIWVPGHWRSTRRGWYWVPGHWK